MTAARLTRGRFRRLCMGVGRVARRTIRSFPVTLSPYPPSPSTFYAIHVTPYTIHHTPYTLHPTPYNLHPLPYNLHHTPYTIRPAPYTPHPTPYTIHPAPYIIHHTPYTIHHTPYALFVLARSPSSLILEIVCRVTSLIRNCSFPLGPPKSPEYMSTMGSQGVTVSYKQGIPVGGARRNYCSAP
jgi:hypothetical protein